MNRMNIVAVSTTMMDLDHLPPPFTDFILSKIDYCGAKRLFQNRGLKFCIFS
jgi:hypothetical protein